ncbi:MAG: hypothetical protein IKI21_10430 [Oscillospiraceae bacterium]|nr:hypothetical protein [Oscillospiraceae bacterium]
MTGTGTQSDPFVPITLTEFIEAVGTSGAYVALDRDIDAAEDPNYGGELTSSIALQCTEMDGSDHVVSGITVRADSFFKQTVSSSCRLKNVVMRDMCHKRNGNNYTLVGSGGNYTVYDHVRLAIKIDASGGWLDFGGYITLTYSAFAIECTGSGSFNRAFFTTCSLDSSTVYIKNPASGFLLQFNNWHTRNAFIFDAPRGSLTLTSRANSPKDLSYYAIVNCNSDTVVNCGDSGTTCLVATDDDTVAVTLANGWTRCSIDQLKDKNYLSSVGWLP